MAKKKSNQRSGKAPKPAASKSVKTKPADEPDSAVESETASGEVTSDETEQVADTKAKSASDSSKSGSARSGQKAKSGDSVFGKGSQKSRPGGKTRPAGKKSGGKGKKGRKSTAPKEPLPWGMISLVTGLVVLVAGLIAIPFVFLPDTPDPDAPIEGLVDYYAQNPPWVEESAHIDGHLEYAIAPPAGGNHNTLWTTCNGVVYDSPVPNEHAVHSLEHGAIWFTYNPDLVTDEQISSLESKVTGIDYTFMTPYPGQEAPMMLTTWGYQLVIDSPDDERIKAFTSKYRLTSSREPGASCSGGTDITGDTPISGPGGM